MTDKIKLSFNQVIQSSTFLERNITLQYNFWKKKSVGEVEKRKKKNNNTTINNCKLNQE